MNTVDPKLIALQFNEYINRQDIAGLATLMAEDHTFIDRKGKIDKGKEVMINGWIEFFKSFPEYKNVFHRVQSQDDLVAIYGFGLWKKESDPDYVIWTARIENDLVAEWRIYENTEENRKKFNLN